MGTMDTPRHVVIVGGGITGLAAAHAIALANREQRLGISCTLLESSARLGGKIQTERTNGLIIEQGPDAMLARKVEGRLFCEQLGLASDLVGSNTEAGGTFVVHRGRLEPMPEGMMLVAPIHVRGWMNTRLLSPLGKLRAGLDLVLPARRDSGDETLASFVSRRFGKEVAQRLAVPLLAAVYGGGSGDLSLKATFAELGALEQTHRSVLLGLRAMARRRGRSPGPAVAGGAKPPAPSPFVTLRRGMSSMVGQAVQALDGVTIRLHAPVASLTALRVNHGPARYRVRLAGGEDLEAGAVILASPAYATAEIVQNLSMEAADLLHGLDYFATTVVVVAYPRERIAHSLQGTGFLVPETERRKLIACTWLTRKWPHVSDPNTILLRCYVGGPGEGAALAALPDEEIVALTCAELRDLMGTEGAPVLSHVYRWPRAIPRYALGHLERVAQAERVLAAFPGVVLAGAAYHGIGVPDCIRQGKAAAEAALSLARVPVARGALVQQVLAEEKVVAS